MKFQLEDTPDKIQTTSVERRSDGSVIAQVEDRAAVHLNSTAYAIWSLCDGETKISEIVAAAATLFAGSADQIRTDILETLAHLRQEGLVV